MDKSFLSIIESGRITRKKAQQLLNQQPGNRQGVKLIKQSELQRMGVSPEIARRTYGRRQNHFLKKAFDNIGYGIKQGTKKIAEQVAIKPVARKSGVDTNKALKAFHESGIADKFGKMNTQLARDAAISVATLGVGSIASGAKSIGSGIQAVKGAATAAKVTNLAKTAGDVAKIAGAGGAALAALKKKNPKAAQQALKEISAASPALTDKISAELGVPTSQAREIADSIAASNVAQTVENIGSQIPTEVKKELINRGRKLDITDIVANKRTSPEMLPKTRSKKRVEDEASLISDTKKPITEKSDNTTLYIVIGVALVVLVFSFFNRG